MKKTKRLTAFILAGVLGIAALSGCGVKNDKTSSSEKSSGFYSVEALGTIDACIYGGQMSGSRYYADYSTYDENTDTSSCGLIFYDFETNEQKSTALENSDLGEPYIDHYYIDEKGQLIVTALVTQYPDDYFEEDLTSSDSSAVSGKTYQEQTISLVYSPDLELIKREDGPIETRSDEDDQMDSGEYEYAFHYNSDGSKVIYGGTDTDNFIKVLDKDDKETGRIPLDSDMSGELIRLADQSYICTYYGDNGLEICRVDLEKMEISKSIASLGNDFMGSLYIGQENHLLLNQGGYFTRINLDTGKSEKLFQFLSCDVNPDNVSCLFELKDGTVGAMVCDYSTDSTEVDIFRKQDKDTASARTELHLATLYSDSALQEQIIAYNKSSDTYRIVLDSYMDESEDTYEDAVKRMNAAITSDNAPDLIDLSTIDYTQLGAKGILEDLTPYIEKDNELSLDSFVPSVLKAYQKDGALYCLPASFTVLGLAGATSAVGSETSWTMKEFTDFAEKLPEGTEIMDSLTSDGLLEMMVQYNMNEYIDWANGECHFNTDDFIALLEFCGKYETSEKYYENYDYENATSEVTRIRNKQLVLQNFSLYDATSYSSTKTIFGEPVTIKGYPTAEGNGVLIIGEYTYGIHAKSKNKDAAWDFIRNYYDKEFQTSWQMSALPVCRTYLDRAFEEAKQQETETAPDGTPYISVWGWEDVELYIPPITDEDIKAMNDIIDKADTTFNLNSDVYSLVAEEAEAFFSGQKSAKDVAEIIQSRVSIYVKENK